MKAETKWRLWAVAGLVGLFALAEVLGRWMGPAPGVVAWRFLEGVRDGRVEVVEKYGNCSHEAAEYVAGFGERMGQEGVKGLTFKVVATRVDGDKATTTVQARHSRDGMGDGRITVRLVKVEGAWKVESWKWEAWEREGKDREDGEDG